MVAITVAIFLLYHQNKLSAMMIRLLLALCTCLPAFVSFGQDCPPNIDFEQGDFSSWECFIGNTFDALGKNTIKLNPSAPTPGRHEIISAATGLQKDFYGNFPTLCPYGGKYSVKLGNTNVGAEAEGISYTFTVPATVDTFTFTYFYAVVFQDPKHPKEQQPRFFVTAYDVASGLVVNCASYDYVSQSSIPGFEVSEKDPNVLYKDWTPASLQFAGMKGREVRLEFKTADCTQSGHFGYAYLDVGSACSNILATAPYCIETNSLILNAPYGFQHYTWYSPDFSTVLGRSRTLTLSPPPATTGTFHVDVEPYPGYGCRDTFTATVRPLPVPDTPVAPSEVILCQQQTSTPLVATPSPGADLLWYTSATGGTASAKAPRPSTAIAGEFFYWVSQQALFGCESFRKKIKVRVMPTPVVSFTVNTARQCENGNQFLFTSTATNLADAVFNWSFGNGDNQGSVRDTTANYSYPASGNYFASLKITNGGLCAATATQPVAVIPKPKAAFTFPQLICQNTTPVQLTDASSGPAVYSPITQWWWTIDGVLASGTQPQAFIARRGGHITVQQVVTTAEGCYSDTNTVLMPVRFQPTAAFTIQGLYCNNEVLQFTSTSSLPTEATGENISTWQWNISGNATSITHPAAVLPAGRQRIQLVTQTAAGCSSAIKDTTIEVFAKPVVTLRLSDSCALRNMQFATTDHNNTVQQWRWSFDGVPQNGSTEINKLYRTAGPHSVVVQSVTNQGCKDTLVRVFTVYDNTAFAGRDTVAAMEEPVQLNAGGYAGTRFSWRPSLGLSSDTVAAPVALLDRNQQYWMEAITKEGCDAKSGIYIKRFKGPQLYLPTAFTPNNDGKNDILKVFPVGIKKFHYLSVYDRWGSIIFKTTDADKGWDGTIKGQPAPTGYFVTLTEATDYKGRPMKEKGAVLLVR